jgi:hypothetical protein
MFHDNLSHDEAKALLTAETEGRQHGDTLVGTSIIGPAASVLIGLLMSAFLLAALYLFPTATMGEFLLIVGGYCAGIGVAVTAYNLGRRSTPRGWLQRYQKGLAISCAVFAGVLALSFLVSERTPFLWVPLAIAIALPISILGTKRVLP